MCDALRDLVSFVQFKKREKQPWRSVTFRLLKVALLHVCFSRFVNCTCKWYQIVLNITNVATVNFYSFD